MIANKRKQSTFEDSFNQIKVNVNKRRTSEKDYVERNKDDSNGCDSCKNKEQHVENSLADDFFGLPTKIKTLLEESKGIKTLYEWQSDLLKLLNSNNQNMIYSVPTSGGKTLVAELMIMKEILLHQKNTLLILPYVSLVQEKVRHFFPFATSLDFLVEEYAGPKGAIPPKIRNKYKSIYIATIEKAHLLITSLMQMDKLNELGLVVVDELHMLGDGSTRGSVLEILLVKLKLAMSNAGHRIRILGMSATLSNANDLGRFLNAGVFQQNFRPVALKEYVKYGRCIYGTNKKETFGVIRDLPETVTKEDPEQLTVLVKEVVPKESCLIFCPTKKHCESIVLMLCKHLRELVKYRQKEKTELIKEIMSANNGHICHILRKSIPFGIVYHHSGLTSEEREFIEAAFLSGVLSCIVCTSTLAAGVNLPAKRVIIRAPFVGSTLLSAARYKQMSGRAGRAGYSDYGESIVITTNREWEHVREIMTTSICECISSLGSDTNGIQMLILSLFELGFIKSLDDFASIITHHTLYGIQSISRHTSITRQITDSFSQLLQLKLIEEKSLDFYDVTVFGKAVVRSLINVNNFEFIYSEVKRSMTAFDLSTDLHLLYLSTLLSQPGDFGIYPNSQRFFDTYSSLTDDEQRAAAVVGICPGLATRYQLQGVADDKIKRFYLTMIAYEIKKNRCDLAVAADRYSTHRGTLQNLLNQLASNASALLRFVSEIPEFEKLKRLLDGFPLLLQYCCTPELIPLLELPAVKIRRAKQLYDAGYRSLTDVAKASASALISVIPKLNKKQAHDMIATAKSLLLATADELQLEANELTLIAIGS